jgi:NAD(P)-dependent dehydrogenase (short-subunit alcohol dehydrogenase family)
MSAVPAGAAPAGAALVTGGAKRIGAMIARHLAARGQTVVIHHRSSPDEAAALAAEIRAGGGTAFTLEADLAQPDQAERVIEQAQALAGRLSLLVNNASRFVFDKPATVTADQLAAHLAPNLVAPVLLARDFAARIAGSGVVINILDQKLANLNPDFFSYTLSKAALAAATEMLAMALAPTIRVCGIAPGLTMIAPKQTPETFDRAWASTPLRQGSSAADIARAVAFIIDTPSITGTTLYVDGGEHLMHRGRDVSFTVA